MNLHTYLLEPRKPTHQFHDTTSIHWLETHRPNILPREYYVSSKTIQVIREKKPWEWYKDSWFLHSLVRDGIHGFRHGCRVSIHAVSLAIDNYDMTGDEIDALILAGLLHDCRRKNDNADMRHGIRAAAWLQKKQNVIPKHLQVFIPAIRFAIAVHNDSYNDIFLRLSYKRFKSFVDILKTADGLDRYRFPRSDWWFSPNFVSLIPNLRNMAFAFDLAFQTESFYVDTKNNIQSMVMAWNKFYKKETLL